MKKIKTGIAILCINFSASIFANQTVLCPNANLIRQSWQQLDYVIPDGDKYSVRTSNPAFSVAGKDWYVETIEVKAAGIDDALNKGREYVKSTLFRVTFEAVPMLGSWICSYYSEHAPVFAASWIEGKKPLPNDIIKINKLFHKK